MPTWVTARRGSILVLVLVVLGVSSGSTADESEAATVATGVASCLTLSGEPARECFRREVGRQLAAVAGREFKDVPRTSTVTFDDGSNASAELLCDLHLRAGTGAGETPSWLRRWGASPQTVSL